MNMAPEQGIFAELEAEEADKQREKQAAKRLDNALRSVMGNKQGRQAIAWALSFTGQESSVTSSDALVMASMSGRRDVGLAILARLKGLCPDAVDLMFKEQRENA